MTHGDLSQLLGCLGVQGLRVLGPFGTPKPSRDSEAFGFMGSGFGERELWAWGSWDEGRGYREWKKVLLRFWSCSWFCGIFRKVRGKKILLQF